MCVPLNDEHVVANTSEPPTKPHIDGYNLNNDKIIERNQHHDLVLQIKQ